MRSQGLHPITSELIKALAVCQTVNKDAVKVQEEQGDRVGFGVLGRGLTCFFVVVMGFYIPGRNRCLLFFYLYLFLASKFATLVQTLIFQCG